MKNKRFVGLFSAVARAGKAAFVSLLVLSAATACVDPAPHPPSGSAGSPDVCTLVFAGNCREQGGASGHPLADAGVGGESGSHTGGDGGSALAGAGGASAGSGGTASAGTCADGQGSVDTEGKDCPGHGGAGANGGASGHGGSPQGGAGSGSSGAGQAGTAAGGTGASGASTSGAGGEGSSGQGGVGIGGSGGGGAGSGDSLAGAGGASGGNNAAGSSDAGSSGTSSGGASGGGSSGGSGGVGGSSEAGASGAGGQAVLKPWGCNNFVVDSGFEDTQPNDDFSRWYQTLYAVGPYVFGGNSWGVDVLSKNNGAWSKLHVPDSGDGVAWAAGPDKDGDFWFASLSSASGNGRLFKGHGDSWSAVPDSPPSYGFSRLAFAPDGTLYAAGYDTQPRLWRRTPSGLWADLIGNHPMNYMELAGLTLVDGVPYLSMTETHPVTFQYAAAHLYGFTAGAWSEFPGVSSLAVILPGLVPSGSHGLAASGAQADDAIQGGYQSTVLFLDLSSKTISVAEQTLGFGYGQVLASPRFGAYLAATQTSYGSAAGAMAVHDGFGLVSLLPFPNTSNSVDVLLGEGSGPSLFFQPVMGANKASLASATCGEL